MNTPYELQKQCAKLEMERDIQRGFYLAAIEQRDAAHRELAEVKEMVFGDKLSIACRVIRERYEAEERCDNARDALEQIRDRTEIHPEVAESLNRVIEILRKNPSHLI